MKPIPCAIFGTAIIAVLILLVATVKRSNNLYDPDPDYPEGTNSEVAESAGFENNPAEQIIWTQMQDNWGNTFLGAVCPICSQQVHNVTGRSTISCPIGHELEWIQPHCPKCNETKTLICGHCNGDGVLEKGCLMCQGEKTRDIQIKFTDINNWEVIKKLPCSRCNGTGKVKSGYDARAYICELCEGTKSSIAIVTCKECNGSGDRNCYRCGGTGKVQCSTCRNIQQ